jgi:SAM-dependent methyltransferase
MSPHFAKVIATDPSPGMISQATKMTENPKISFRQTSVEDLSFLPDKSIDMAVAGQCAHWFDYEKAWPELARVIKPGGSLAMFGYKDNIFLGYPRANRIFDKFCYGRVDVEPGVESMNHYWERPGRDKVRNLLRDVEPPSTEWSDVERILFDIDADAAEIPSSDVAWMTKQISLGSFESYVRTYSALQGWKDAHPEKKSLADGGSGDLVDMLMAQLVESEPEWRELGRKWPDAQVTTVWGTYILLARRR